MSPRWIRPVVEQRVLKGHEAGGGVLVDVEVHQYRGAIGRGGGKHPRSNELKNAGEQRTAPGEPRRDESGFGQGVRRRRSRGAIDDWGRAREYVPLLRPC